MRRRSASPQLLPAEAPIIDLGLMYWNCAEQGQRRLSRGFIHFFEEAVRGGLVCRMIFLL